MRTLAISGDRSEVTVDALSRLASVSVLTRATVGVMGSVRTGMFRVEAVTVRVSALTFCECLGEEVTTEVMGRTQVSVTIFSSDLILTGTPVAGGGGCCLGLEGALPAFTKSAKSVRPGRHADIGTWIAD